MLNSIDIENMIKTLKIIKMYDNEEKNIFDKIKNIMIVINNYYNTNNYNKLINIQTDLIKKMIVINVNHCYNEIVMNKNIEKYIDTTKKVENLFNNLEAN